MKTILCLLLIGLLTLFFAKRKWFYQRLHWGRFIPPSRNEHPAE